MLLLAGRSPVPVDGATSEVAAHDLDAAEKEKVFVSLTTTGVCCP